jgi:hypothetical protein
MSISKKSKALLSALGCVLVFSGQANAGNPEIYVNGERMNAVEMIALDLLNCAGTVPNGRYWINWVTRAWGYEGGPQQDFLPQCGQQAEASSGGGSSSGGYFEDRMFERYGIDMIQNPVYR